MLEKGIKGIFETTVTEMNTAKAMGSGTLKVFATPAMVAAMEHSAVNCVASALDPETTTVGTSLQISHLSATPMGMKVRAEAELTEIDRRRLVFSVKAFDEAGLIGEGMHERFIVNSAKFTENADNKKERRHS